jgi:formylglycine-generating enzyme required for sulfatase activity
MFSLLVVAAGCASSASGPAPAPDAAAAPDAPAAADAAGLAEASAAISDTAAPFDAATACGEGSSGSAWAGWPMVEPRARAYDQDPSAGVVVDRTTSLMWQRRAAPDLLEWADAQAYCRCLALAGHRDWRLPTRIELLTIVDYTRQDPSIDGAVFPDTPVTWFWTASTVANAPVAAWYLSFMDGNTHEGEKTTSYGVRCVRQPVPARQPYRLSADTVTDPNTGLTWQRAVDPTKRDWEGARAHCAGSSLAGGGWRLPTMAELQTLIDEGTTEPAIDGAAFPDTPAEGFWAATPLADMPPYYWFVHFERGVAYNSMSLHEYHVRCVR